MNWLQRVSQNQQSAGILMDLVSSKIDVNAATQKLQELQLSDAHTIEGACGMMPDMLAATSDPRAMSALEQLHHILCHEMHSPHNPALVELLGTDIGDILSREILAKLNSLVAVKIGANTRKIHSSAKSCVADKQNLKQYFVAPNEDWVCVVTASGPFRGDEAFHYNRDKDNVSVLRLDDQDEYSNVTDAFNVIHEFVEKENV